MPRTVGIVGAGIGGLALAGALHRAGVDVTVLEQAPAIRAGGSGITLAPNALTALDLLGTGEVFRDLQRSQQVTRGGQRTPSGRWMSTLPHGVVSSSLALDRAELHALLSAELPPEALRTGCDVRAADPGSGEVTFHTAGGTDRARFDLVVGADGLRSAVRGSCVPDPGSRYAGYAAWRAVTAETVDVDGLVTETWGTAARFGIVPLHDGRVYWFAVHTAPEPSAGQARLDDLRATFAGWHDPIPQLLTAPTTAPVQYLPIRELARPLPSYASGRVVLLGDAAHAMTPNLGQGACQALEDAATLAALITANIPTEEIGPAYDRQRRRRSQAIARRSRLVGAVAQTGGIGAARARHALMSLVPDVLIARQTAAVTSWDGPDPAP